MAASDKTEKATPKKLEEARKKGQVARSMDLNGAVVLLASLLALSAFGPGMLQRMEEAGLVKEAAARGDDRRRVFAILPAGRRALATEAERLARLTALVRAKRLLPDEA